MSDYTKVETRLTTILDPAARDLTRAIARLARLGESDAHSVFALMWATKVVIQAALVDAYKRDAETACQNQRTYVEMLESAVYEVRTAQPTQLVAMLEKPIIAGPRRVQ